MEEYERRLEMERHIAELRRLLAQGDLAPDTRVRALTALIEADAADRGQGLAHALRSFCEVAEILAMSLDRLPRPDL